MRPAAVTEALIVALVGTIGALAGGVAVEIIRTRSTRQTSDLELLHDGWRGELDRMRTEMTELRAVVVALSAEVSKLGGDPVAVRLATTRSGKDRPPEQTM